ncbi:Succinate dehydrogenase [ubiquinone] cytochrome b small subunit [Picochlorum sp. SENEW3]|nr:Succinate dehydrogenase [ubiquinone] cytochrome b small subunit [Picochlorum sp. SENEW3]WPT14601.1 Succinate dehydrogenase [ubiquinone] cytochrome b small subunit [Picochlorum sp. SENEW3]
MNSFLFADSAGPKVQRLYHQSHYVLAGLIPATLVSEKSSIPAKLSDIGLAAAIPVHSHIAMNYVVSDYIPKSAQFPVRAGVAGLTGVMFLGLLKTAILGPGIGGAIKELWSSSPSKK